MAAAGLYLIDGIADYSRDDVWRCGHAFPACPAVCCGGRSCQASEMTGHRATRVSNLERQSVGRSLLGFGGFDALGEDTDEFVGFLNEWQE